jgi:hypothetical protein
MKSTTRGHLAIAALVVLICLPQELRASETKSGTSTPKAEAANEAPGKVIKKEEAFLIGFAKSDFVADRKRAENEKAGPFDKVALHGVSWFPKEGSEADDMYFMGHVSLDTPITPAQYGILMAVREKHGSEQVYLKFSARLSKEGTTEFQGKLLGYYVVTYQEREGFLSKLKKDREAPGFVAVPEQGGASQSATDSGNPEVSVGLRSAVIVVEGESRRGVARSEAMTIADADTLNRLEACFPGYQNSPSSENSGGWERGYQVYFNLANGKTLSAIVSENGGGGTWSMGHGDLITNGKFTEFVDSLRKE